MTGKKGKRSSIYTIFWGVRSSVMATFKIDDVEYDTDNLDTTQKRVVGLYQKSLQDEGEALNSLEIARAARIELGRKLKELVIEGGSKKK